MSKSATKKSKKQETKDILKTLVPYFKLTIGQLGGRATCKLAGYAQPNDKIQDEGIESVDDGKSFTYGAYDVNYLTQHCHISGSYLVKNDKLPIYNKSVMYSRQFLSGNLFSCYLYFTLDEQTKTALTDYTKYYNRLLSGTFTLELMTIDDDFLDNFIAHKREKLESEYMIDIIDEFENANDEEKENLLSKMTEKIDVLLDVYKNYFKPITIENPRKLKIIQAMDKLFANPHMSELIEFGLKFRDKKRIEESCPDQTYERPKKVINLKDLKEFEGTDELEARIDAMLENCSDSDYSDKE